MSSVECGGVCGVWSVECGVQCVDGVRSLECKVWSEECKV